MRKFYSRILMIAIILLLGFNSKLVYADDASEVNNPVYNESTESTIWDYVYFGSYPQSKLRTSQITDEILKADYNSNGDAVVAGQRYRRLLVDDNYQYFKYEPIKWRVLENKDGYFLLMADNMLEHEPRCNYAEDMYRRIYESSILRSILNGYNKNYNELHEDYSAKGANFINLAFVKMERDALVEPFEGSGDLVMIPTRDILWNEKYGFGSEYTRVVESTDYSRVKDEEEYNCFAYIASRGNIAPLSDGEDYPFTVSGISIAPIIKINADSALWSKQLISRTAEQRNISNVDYDIDGTNYTYSGNEIKPMVSLYDSNYILVEGIDYRVSYADCVNAGKAKVIVKGLNDYSGSRTVYYNINKAAQKITVPASITKE